MLKYFNVLYFYYIVLNRVRFQLIKIASSYIFYYYDNGDVI